MDSSAELSSLLATLEDVTVRVTHLVESSESKDGVDAELVQLERSFDGGLTWIVCNLGSAGTLAQWNGGGPIGLTFGEPERQVAYRFNCIAYTSGTINYRISQTGGADESLAIGPLTGG